VDYTEGWFLLTTNVAIGGPSFGEIWDERFYPNRLGEIIIEAWNCVWKPERAEVATWQPMPTHVHGVVRPTNGRNVSRLMASFKARVTREARRQGQAPPDRALWQRSFHIRRFPDERAVNAAVRYVDDNPKNWP
jgi:REP element-mobilizing transposase RayT